MTDEIQKVREARHKQIKSIVASYNWFLVIKEKGGVVTHFNCYQSVDKPLHSRLPIEPDYVEPISPFNVSEHLPKKFYSREEFIRILSKLERKFFWIISFKMKVCSLTNYWVCMTPTAAT